MILSNVIQNNACGSATEPGIMLEIGHQILNFTKSIERWKHYFWNSIFSGSITAGHVWAHVFSEWPDFNFE